MKMIFKSNEDNKNRTTDHSHQALAAETASEGNISLTSSPPAPSASVADLFVRVYQLL